MTKLTHDQIARLNEHLAKGASTHGILLGELWVRTKDGNIKKNRRIAKVRRELVAWLRETVWSEKSGEMVIGRHDRIVTDVPISYPLIAKLLGFTDHTAALRAHQAWKRENACEITPEELERRKAAARGLGKSTNVV